MQITTFSNLQLLLLSFLVTLPNPGSAKQEIFIDYGENIDGTELSKLFYGVQDGFFVDLGSYDSISTSNTLNLQAMGWTGINVEASPSRLSPFFLTRPTNLNLNFAIGQSDTIETLYELPDDSLSTINQRVVKRSRNKFVTK
jgi:hypothetical protein